MQCSNCGTINPEGAKFCRACGRPLGLVAAAPAAQPAAPAPAPAAAAPPQPAPRPAWLGRLVDPTNLLLALIATGLGALAGFLSATYIPKLPPQYQLVPAALPVEVSGVAVLVALLCLLPFMYWIADRQADQRRLKFTRLLHKEKAFFMSVHDDVSILAGERGEHDAD